MLDTRLAKVRYERKRRFRGNEAIREGKTIPRRCEGPGNEDRNYIGEEGGGYQRKDNIKQSREGDEREKASSCLINWGVGGSGDEGRESARRQLKAPGRDSLDYAYALPLATSTVSALFAATAAAFNHMRSFLYYIAPWLFHDHIMRPGCVTSLQISRFLYIQLSASMRDMKERTSHAAASESGKGIEPTL